MRHPPALVPANLQYTYDLAGRRTSVSGSLASTQLPDAVSSATYNASNQLTQWGATTMTYDANGNTLNDGTNAYTWDARNRLVSANNAGATFSYDPLGRRTDGNFLGVNTNYLYDGVNPVQELNGSTVTANLLTGGVDEYFTRTDSTGTSNFLTDALGSTMELTDSGGNSQVQYSYAPYGSISITGTTNNSYTYTDRESDGLGLYYYRARYYNPATGRFLSEDPSGLNGGINEYAYVGGDPMDFVDPSGLDKNAPNNPAHPNQNCGQILSGAALTVGLDAAGVVAGAIPGTGAALVTAQVAIGVAGAANAAYHKDVGASFAAIGTTQLAPIAAISEQVGWTSLQTFGGTVARALPGIGSFVSAAYFYKDATEAIDKYRACKAGIGG